MPREDRAVLLYLELETVVNHSVWMLETIPGPLQDPQVLFMTEASLQFMEEISDHPSSTQVSNEKIWVDMSVQDTFPKTHGGHFPTKAKS